MDCNCCQLSLLRIFLWIPLLPLVLGWFWFNFINCIEMGLAWHWMFSCGLVLAIRHIWSGFSWLWQLRLCLLGFLLLYGSVFFCEFRYFPFYFKFWVISVDLVSCFINYTTMVWLQIDCSEVGWLYRSINWVGFVDCNYCQVGLFCFINFIEMDLVCDIDCSELGFVDWLFLNGFARFFSLLRSAFDLVLICIHEFDKGHLHKLDVHFLQRTLRWW